MMRFRGAIVLAVLAVWLATAAQPTAPTWDRDTFSDTWVATDALGRRVPVFPEVSARRSDRSVAMFYFLWLGSHVVGGPHDITKILAQGPAAMQKPDSPFWGPLQAA